MAYEVRVGPTPLAASGDPDTGIALAEVTELVYFHWNDTVSVASLVFILLYLLSRSFSKQRILYRALQVAMTLDLFAFVVASASRNSLQLPTFVYISVLAPVFLYAGIMAMVSMSEMFLTCAIWRRVLREKMEQYCVPNWLIGSPSHLSCQPMDTQRTGARQRNGIWRTIASWCCSLQLGWLMPSQSKPARACHPTYR